MPINCPSDAICESIAPDKDQSKGIFTACEDSERRNDRSRKICSVVYVDVKKKL